MNIAVPCACAALLTLFAASAWAQEPPAVPPPTPGVPAEIMPIPPAAAPVPPTASDSAADLSPGSKNAAQPLTTDPSTAVDAIPEAELDKILQTFSQLYIDPSALANPALKRATIQGLLQRLGPGAEIAPPRATPVSAASSPFRFEILEGRIGYVRLGTLEPKTAGEIDTALQQVAAQKLGALVVDVRAMLPGAHLDLTAEVVRRFTPKGRMLFTVKRRDAKDQIFTSKDEPTYRGVLVVLVDEDTAGDGEIIAAILRSQAKAMIIGERTEGEAAEYTEIPLGQPGIVLRLATSQVVVEAQSDLFPKGIKPDLAVQVTPEVTRAALSKALEGGVGPLVFETERPRMNEAALVAGTNPELEAIAQRLRGEKSRVPLRDPVLQRAVDFITTISIYEKGAAAKR